ncbi:MAG: hypothetical protein MUE51_16055 [Thermoleophilia bacterium]|jgi:carbamoyl-phosphate synthase large subunit|nr:hypothetical protein [Thermoleophilia bacterium]
MRRVLVTGAGGPAGVNFVRSLRASGRAYHIVGTDIDRFHLEWPDLDGAYESPRTDDPGYVRFLNDVIAREGIDLVHPQPDGEVRRISDVRDELDARTFLPAQATVATCQDKLASARAWEAAGIRTLPAVAVAGREDLERAAAELGLPLWLRATTGAGGRGSTPMESVEVGEHWLAYWRLRGRDWDFVAEPMLPGANLAFTSLWRDGEPVCSQVRERLEYIYPYLAPSGVTGTPVLAVTRDRPDAEAIALRAVRAVDPSASGVFCVDLKEDAAGVPWPTEINCGRFFTTSYFFTAAGVNIPDAYVRLAFGEPPWDAPPPRLEPGLHWARHIDCPAVLVREGDLRAVPLARP